MRKIKIAIDSSSNLISKDNIKTVPLSLTLGTSLYVDDDSIDVLSFVKDMEEYNGKTTSACPSTSMWLDAFNGDKEIYAIALTSKVSGCYNSLNTAKDIYLDEHPDAKILTFDSLTTGPELVLFVEKIQELVNLDTPFEAILPILEDYKKRTHLSFMFRSLDNFAKNGRVNASIAKLIKFLHLSIVGQASSDGDIKPTNKSHGEKHGLEQLYKNMLSNSYNGGKVRIAHTDNIKAANKLKEIILNDYPNADVTISENKALCAYYTERFGILVGYESK